ncbi:hypothetical protein [Pseudomonas sp. B21-053]|uniref:hypothetical protein n=1 Tax=Pseudomonas sp. B21-053 TaxID=2895493 RepID=UPI002231E4CF|nr:hypothetical protein [Pseudomonas sp. B21-053]UZE14753.1 hypothetical protein LOY68_14465 [Pseudomonas sp. B21-053]
MSVDIYSLCNNEFLLPIVAKLNRSARQIENINKEFERVGSNVDVDFTTEINQDRLGFALKINGFKKLELDDLSVQIGECAHNLRSVLDNLAYALARLKSDPPLAPNQIAFPIFLEEKDFIVRWPKNKLEKFFDSEIIEVIRNIQPFNRKGGEEGLPVNDALIVLSNLNNADKHRLPNLVVFSQENIKFNGRIEYKSEEDCFNDGPPNFSFNCAPIVRDFILLEAKTLFPIVKINGGFEISGKVKLELEGQYYDIVKYLVDTRSYVISVCKMFDRFFL